MAVFNPVSAPLAAWTVGGRWWLNTQVTGGTTVAFAHAHKGRSTRSGDAVAKGVEHAVTAGNAVARVHDVFKVPGGVVADPPTGSPRTALTTREYIVDAPLSATTAPTPTHRPGARRGETLLNDIAYRFRLLAEGPAPLSVDGRQLGHGLPRRQIALPELSAILMHPSCGFEARDTVWRLLVARARSGDPCWRASAVGVALPGLRFKAHLLAKLFTGDVQAAIVEHFLRALSSIDTTRPGVVANLLNAAFSKARTELRQQEPTASGAPNFAPGSALPPAPYGHPDLVLVRAVRAGVLTVEEADLIGVTYLEGVTLTDYAEQRGQPRWNLYKRRAAAVARLTAALDSGDLSDPYADVVAEATLTVVPEPAPNHHRP